jgi:hypothetical protein
MVEEGFAVQFVLLSDVNADDFVDRTTVPIFEDPSGDASAWEEMQTGAAKHDTFVFGHDGVRTLYWDATEHTLGNWSADIRAAVEAIGK